MTSGTYSDGRTDVVLLREVIGITVRLRDDCQRHPGEHDTLSSG